MHRGGSGTAVAALLGYGSMAGVLLPPVSPGDSYRAHLAARNAAARQRLHTQGMQLRRAAQQRYAALFGDIDLLIMPTSPAPAARFADERSPWQRPEELPYEIVARYTRIFNLIGYPAITVPCGFSAGGLPVGFQIAGRPFEETNVLRAAHAYQQATAWHAHHPSEEGVRT